MEHSFERSLRLSLSRNTSILQARDNQQTPMELSIANPRSSTEPNVRASAFYIRRSPRAIPSDIKLRTNDSNCRQKLSYHLPCCGLPPELREQIYEELLVSPGGLHFVNSKDGKVTCTSHIKIAVLLVNHMVHDEAIRVLFAKNTFNFRDVPDEAALYFLQNLPTAELRRSIPCLVLPGEEDLEERLMFIKLEMNLKALTVEFPRGMWCNGIHCWSLFPREHELLNDMLMGNGPLQKLKLQWSFVWESNEQPPKGGVFHVLSHAYSQA